MQGIAEAWIREGRAQRLPEALSSAFDAYLCSLPWHVSSLDWSRMPRAEVINVAKVDIVRMREWFSRTRIGRHSHIAIWYSVDKGGLIVPTNLAIDSFDELYWGAPGARYAFGLTIDGDRLEPAFNALLEYGRGDELTATGLES